jgi:3-dehydroquinate dehydratase-2
VPAVEVHISDVMAREPWRHVSVLAEGCIATIAGEGVAGYREAIVTLRRSLRP